MNYGYLAAGVLCAMAYGGFSPSFRVLLAIFFFGLSQAFFAAAFA